MAQTDALHCTMTSRAPRYGQQQSTQRVANGAVRQRCFSTVSLSGFHTTSRRRLASESPLLCGWRESKVVDVSAPEAGWSVERRCWPGSGGEEEGEEGVRLIGRRSCTSA